MRQRALFLLSPFGPLISPAWSVLNALARAVRLPRAIKLRCPVISVGNIVSGGVGKTEIASLIARRLSSQGKTVVVACRGYGSKWERTGGFATSYSEALALCFPDEALVLLKTCEQDENSGAVKVCVGADRVGTLLRHWETLSPDVVVLDDGLQHFSIARDLDVVVHDFRVRWPLLRDLPSLMARAGARVSFSDVPRLWRRMPWTVVRYAHRGIAYGSGVRDKMPREVVAFCGIGNPSRFKKSLEEHGVVVRAFQTFPDHHRFSREDVLALFRLADQYDRASLVCTLKDFVKLENMLDADQLKRLAWTPIEIRFIEGEDVFWKPVFESAGVRGAGDSAQ